MVISSINLDDMYTRIEIHYEEFSMYNVVYRLKICTDNYTCCSINLSIYDIVTLYTSLHSILIFEDDEYHKELITKLMVTEIGIINLSLDKMSEYLDFGIKIMDVTNRNIMLEVKYELSMNVVLELTNALEGIVTSYVPKNIY